MLRKSPLGYIHTYGLLYGNTGRSHTDSLWMSFKGICSEKEARLKRLHMIGFHLHDRQDKPLGTESSKS